MFVPVVNKNQKPLMPTTPSRARRWIKSGKATGFWKGHVFCVRINENPSSNKVQDIAVGIDPGSKKEGFTIKSKSNTYLNVQVDAIQNIEKLVKTRARLRRVRRQRKTPYRKSRWNRSCLTKNKIPPSTKARWQWKLNILKWLNKLFPVKYVIIEDIKSKTKKGKVWNKSFSPLQIGKKWFCSQVPGILTRRGYETKEMRDELGLLKLKNKLSDNFHAHCVDSWVLANSIVGGNIVDNKQVLCVSQIKFFKRRLNSLQPSKKGVRKRVGGTTVLGFKKGSIINHYKYGIVYIGGTSKGRVSLHSLKTGKRLCNHAKLKDCKFIAYNGRRAFCPNNNYV